MVFWLLFSNESIQNILSLSATVAPFASAGIRPVVNRLNQDTTVYYGLVFCLFSWPYMVKWHNSGIIKHTIIHSKYFSLSDWLKSHAKFIITSYCRPNLEEDNIMWTDDVNRAAKLLSYWTVNREDLGTRLSCFGSEYKMAEHFTRFTRKK